jgi:hypothetical protein
VTVSFYLVHILVPTHKPTYPHVNINFIALRTVCTLYSWHLEHVITGESGCDRVCNIPSQAYFSSSVFSVVESEPK